VGAGYRAPRVRNQLASDSRLGPNPVEFLEHYLGDWSLRCCCDTRPDSAAQIDLDRVKPIRCANRGPVGLRVSLPALLDLLVFDLGSHFRSCGYLGSRTYIARASRVDVLLPLAITSTDRGNGLGRIGNLASIDLSRRALERFITVAVQG